MDPNETLKQLRELANSPDVEYIWEAEVHEIVELFQALDTWLSKGGFLPDDWDD